MLVMKFGGTSVATAERIRVVADLVADSPEPVVVVTSALGGVTDALVNAAAGAERGEEIGPLIEPLRDRHLDTANDVAASHEDATLLRAALAGPLEELADVLEGIRRLREVPERSRARLLGLGERLAAPIVAAALRARGIAAQAVDATGMIVVEDGPSGSVDAVASRTRTRETLGALPDGVTPVITGFVASRPDGHPTTLARGGSDYTATLVGSFLGAREIWIWTDVDGVMTADPRLVPEARVLPALTYQEAAEMAYYGSKVLHPRTMIPAVAAGIPVRIRNTLRPEVPGTLISTAGGAAGPHGVKTVTAVRELDLITLEGNGMVGVPGVVQRVFAAVAALGVNVYLISQASSEHNITFVVESGAGPRVIAALEHAFVAERTRGQIDAITVRAPVGVVAVIGEGMRGIPGIAQRLFTALGRARLNVLAIAQGSSERNLSVVVDQSDVRRAVGAAHSRFGLTRDAHLFVLGKGLVGGTLLRQIADHRAVLAGEHGVGLTVVGVAGRDATLHDDHGIDDERLRAIAAGADLRALGGRARPDDVAWLDHLAETRWLDVIVVDTTAADTLAVHRAALERGFHVVTANKIPLSGPRAEVRALFAAAEAHGVDYQFETTFGAGLPALATMRELTATGDRILRVEGCLSGSLGFIGSALEAGERFSDAVRTARERGYTEPDPRDDLSGTDVARKALIIARQLGHDLDLADVPLPSLLPPDLRDAPDVATFLAGLDAMDAPMAERVAAARRDGAVLRFVATVDDAGARVEFGPVPADSPAGQLRGPDNVLVFTTDRYREHALTIRGPGAGAEVTAGGVLGDILKIVRTA